MAARVNIPAGTWFQGIDIGLEIPVTDADEAAVAMTGWTLKWYVWPSQFETSGTALLTVLDASITKFNVSGTDDGARITIADTDTITAAPAVAVEAGTYYHELWRTDEGNERILAYGDVVLEPSPRRQS